jgi:hypothetical protein
LGGLVTRALSTLAAVCILTASVEAQPVNQARPPAQSAQVTPHQFLDAIIASLGRSHMAIKAANDKANDPSLVERMTANQNASVELGIAAGNIQRFMSAQAEDVRASTSGSIDAYSLMRKALGIQLALYEKVDAAKSLDDLAGLRRQISGVKVSYQQASAILVEATTLACLSSVVADPQDPANHVVLNMTAAQKAQLVKALELWFGPALRKKADDDTGPMLAAKALLGNLEKEWSHAE